MNVRERYRIIILIISLLFLLSFSILRAAEKGTCTGVKFQAVVTMPWIRYVLKTIGGNRVKVIKVLASPKDDPHRILPRPSYLVAMRRANLLVYNGLFLESGYLPKLVENSRNPLIRPSSPRSIELSSFLSKVLERHENPTQEVVTADLHPFGNPHYLYDPRRVLEVSRGLYLRLSQLDPDCHGYYRDNYLAFERRLRRKMAEWQRELAPLKGRGVVEYHKMFEYLADFAGFRIIGTVEPVPGVPPSPAHIQKLVEKIKEEKPILLLTTYYYEDESCKRIEELTGLPYVKLPHDLGTVKGTSTYEDLMDTIVHDILKAIRKEGNER